MRTILVGLAVALAAAPGMAGSASKSGPEAGTRAKTYEIPAGSYVALRWDAGKGEFDTLRAPPPPPGLPARAEKVLDRVPAWLRDDLARRLRGLLLVPLTVAEGALPASLEALGKVAPGTEIAADVDGDGLPDRVSATKDGEVRWRRGRGVPAKPWTLALEKTVKRRFPQEVGLASRPVAYGGRLAVGNLDGEVALFPAGPGASAPLPVPARFAAPALGDLDGDGKPELLVGSADGGFYLGTGAGKLKRLPGLSAGSYSSPCLADLDGDGDLDLLSGNREGKIVLFRNTGTAGAPSFSRDDAGNPFAAIDVGDSSAPAAADLDGDGNVDLVVGNQEGALHAYLGPAGKEDEDVFRGVDLGEMAAPAVLLPARAGRPPAGLVVGRLDGDLLYYEISRSDGRLAFTERDSWSFTPGTTAKDLAELYEKRYFPEARPLLVPRDAKTRDAYLSLLESTPGPYLDEVAFTVAHTPAEVLRVMARLGEADLLLTSAKAVYEMAGRVPYAKIVEKGDRTTLAYRGAGGRFVECPPAIYYWWVVHPRILYEIPCRIDASFWDVSAKQRGLTDSEWWKKKPETDIHSPTGKGVFWRRGLVTDDRYGKSLFDSAGGAKTLREALWGVQKFLARNAGGVGLMRFGYETQDLQPWLIYAKHYGSCGEHSILGAACARTMLVPACVVTDRGEDHQWNEWWDTDGAWHHWDCCGPKSVDTPWGSTEGREHQGKTVSAVTRWRGDDRMDAVTGTVWNDPDWKYTTRGAGYTDTAAVTVRVTDRLGAPLDGALVLVRSHWHRRDLITIWGYTDGEGRVRFGLGYESNGGYTIEALTPCGAAGVANYPVEENQDYVLTLRAPGRKPRGARPWWTGKEGAPEAAGGPSARILASVIRPPNLVTGRRYRIDSWLATEHGYRGTGCEAIPSGIGELAEVLVFSAGEYEKFLEGRPCETLYRAPLRGHPDLSAGRRDDGAVTVLSNLTALLTSITVEVSPGAAAITDTTPPEAAFAKGARTVARGEVLKLGSVVKDDTGVARLLLSCDAWPEPREVGEDVPFDTGNGGPLPPGTYTLRLIARDAAGNEGRSGPVRVTVTPARVFRHQKIHQDDPDDPLKKCSWIYGPFDLPAGERFFLARATGTTPGFDMDMYLYLDRNGNGRVDGPGEVAAKSTSPTANERIYLTDPKPGTYWLYCQGFKVEGDAALLDVEVYPAGVPRSVIDVAPAGRLRERPAEMTGRFDRRAGIEAGSVRISLDGGDVTGRAAIDRGGFRLPAPADLAADTEHVVSVRFTDRAGGARERTWRFTVDTRPPVLVLVSPEPGTKVAGRTEIRVRASDEGGKVTVTMRIEGRKEQRFRAVKEEAGIYRLGLDAEGWAPGEHYVWITARDAAGNETERVLRLVVAE